jgi:hypothetical protein
MTNGVVLVESVGRSGRHQTYAREGAIMTVAVGLLHEGDTP